MWLMIFCYFCCKRKKRPQLSAGEKRKKWLRLVAVMSVKQYGSRLISNFFYAFLIAEALTSMRSIWKDFKEYSDCNNEYTANLTRLVSEQYSQAADELAAAVMETSECITGTLDVDIAGFRVGLGDAAGGLFGRMFGWFSPGDGSIPTADLNLQSNSDKIMQDIADDLDILEIIAWWVRRAGYIMTFVTVGIIILKATYYTVENIPWKPGTVGLIMRFVEAFRVVAIYAILVSLVFLQAYLTDKSCQVNVNNTVIETPMCEVVGEQCEFVCVKYQQNFTSPCTECDIPYAWWWVEPYSWPNILGAIYLLYIVLVVLVELFEARRQRKEMRTAELREEEEELERERQEKLENDKRRKKKKKKSSSYKPPNEQIIKDDDDEEMRIQIESDEYEEKPRKKKSRSKTKSSRSKSSGGGSSKRILDGKQDSEIEADLDLETVSQVGRGGFRPSSSYQL